MEERTEQTEQDKLDELVYDLVRFSETAMDLAKTITYAQSSPQIARFLLGKEYLVNGMLFPLAKLTQELVDKIERESPENQEVVRNALERYTSDDDQGDDQGGADRGQIPVVTDQVIASDLVEFDDQGNEQQNEQRWATPRGPMGDTVHLNHYWDDVANCRAWFVTWDGGTLGLSIDTCYNVSHAFFWLTSRGYVQVAGGAGSCATFRYRDSADVTHPLTPTPPPVTIIG